jgi:hypothetical protein
MVLAERTEAWKRLRLITAYAEGLGWEPMPHRPYYWHLPGTTWVLRVTLQDVMVYRWLKRRAATMQRKFLPTQVRQIAAVLTEIVEGVRAAQEVAL